MATLVTDDPPGRAVTVRFRTRDVSVTTGHWGAWSTVMENQHD
jgi:hypothetical protein